MFMSMNPLVMCIPIDGNDWIGQDGTDDQDATEVDTSFDADSDPNTQDSVEDALTALDTAITDLETANANDGDTDSTNEIQDATEVDLSTPLDINDDGTAETTVEAAIAQLNTDLDASDTADGDTDSTNEIQNASEVDLSTPLDIDGDGTDETTVQQALADLLTATTAAKQVFHAEYAGAVFGADGSDNELFITSDRTESPERMNYYEVSNGETSGSDQDYDIVLQYTLPDNFNSWASSNPLTIEYEGTADASFQTTVHKGSTTLVVSSTQSGTGSGTFSSFDIATNSQLTSLVAGDTVTLVIKASVSSVSNVGDSWIRLGDVTFNYNRNVL